MDPFTTAGYELDLFSIGCVPPYEFTGADFISLSKKSGIGGGPGTVVTVLSLPANVFKTVGANDNGFLGDWF